MFVFIGVLLSLVAIGYLCKTDPKRRRVFKLEAYEGQRHTKLALFALFLPGIILGNADDWVGFTTWCGAVCCFGWFFVALPPTFWARFDVLFSSVPDGEKETLPVGE